MFLARHYLVISKEALFGDIIEIKSMELLYEAVHILELVADEKISKQYILSGGFKKK